MNFIRRLFDSGRPEDDERLTMVQVSVAQLKRQFLYDSGLPERNEISPSLDLTPVSLEVDEMEARASDNRMVKIYPIKDIITTYAGISADIMIAVSHAGKAPDSIDPIVAEHTRAIFRTVSAISISCFLASMLDIGLLHGHYPVPAADEDADV